MDADEEYIRKSRLMRDIYIHAYTSTDDEDYEILRHPHIIVIFSAI